MSMTAQVKAELAQLPISKECCLRAETVTLLRLCSALQIRDGKPLVEVELDSLAAAERLRRSLHALYGHQSLLITPPPSSGKAALSYVVRVEKGAARLGKQTGLVDGSGRLVTGLPPNIVVGPMCDAVASWRGAFQARGSLTQPGRASSMEISCPGPEVALALVGSARRLSIAAKAKEARGGDRVVIRDGDAIGAMLTRMGAHETVLAWEERRLHREVRATANRLANFDDANQRRSARAAVAAGARAQRALDILSHDVPDHLKLAGELRVQHREASLEELGRLHEPPLTKDAIAGRIRRLLAMADKRAGELGIPDTETHVDGSGDSGD
ncbi:MAG: DNA-binding protein WhiA [Actinomycetales bacterium]|nr:DNA-binding protein WhiA [Actinomycetales bacterium]